MFKCDVCGFTKDGETPIICPVCNSSKWIDEDLIIIKKISNDNAFIQAMIDLKEKDIIEYNLKISQFRNQVHQQESMKQQLYEQQNSNQLKCPTCGSTNVKKISATSKIGGAMMFGLLSKTARSQFKCEKCGYKW